MEIRILRNFLEIAREENMTRAAERLHISQPSLSKQMKVLESELGKKLFIRSNYNLHLTDEGMLLRKRAEDLLDLSDKIIHEFKSLDDITGGDIYLGCAESYLIKYLAMAIKSLQTHHPQIRYHITSGDTVLVAEQLDKGLLDFAFIVEPPNLSKYNYLEIPETDTFGLLLKKDHPLSNKPCLTVDDLLPYAIFCSEQSIHSDLTRWCGEKIDQMNISATFNLTNNAAVFVREGLGLALTFDKLLEISDSSSLCFRPLSPTLEVKMYIIWKKYQVFTPAASLLLEEMKHMLQK
ncbi:LysR family transcriptional regulator [Clostridium estertheticum]|uniref:LysR family transcriptional regulator n=1 Tax=Clostridium estertheticum TaxID=238834 RepID=UPI001C0DC607|nr:LysR family transcriptional regulator [Clostridium estertheticum]MBU3213816.1 LysR family transcriptional regulator [Clostridium estertheticum]WAG53699.1 LysR family transcriptional regulator [Clostridium estertheticum]